MSKKINISVQMQGLIDIMSVFNDALKEYGDIVRMNWGKKGLNIILHHHITNTPKRVSNEHYLKTIRKIHGKPNQKN